MPHNPSRYTPTPNTTRPGMLDHIRGIENELPAVFDSDGTSEPFSTTNAASANLLIFRGHNTVADSVYFKRADNSGYDPVFSFASFVQGTATIAELNDQNSVINQNRAEHMVVKVSDGAPGGTTAYAISDGSNPNDPWLALASITMATPS